MLRALQHWLWGLRVGKQHDLQDLVHEWQATKWDTEISVACWQQSFTELHGAVLKTHLRRVDMLRQGIRCVQVQDVQRLALQRRVLCHARVPAQVTSVQDQLQYIITTENDLLTSKNTVILLFFGIWCHPQNQ